MSKEKQARREQWGFAQKEYYNIQAVPGAPQNNNVTANPDNRAGEQPASMRKNGESPGPYRDISQKHDAMGATVVDHPRSNIRQGNFAAIRGHNQLPFDQTPPTPGEKEFAYLEANRFNGMGSFLPTQIPETFSTMGLVGQPAPIQGAKDPEGTPPQNSMMAFMSFDPSGSIIPGNNNTQKNNRGNA